MAEYFIENVCFRRHGGGELASKSDAEIGARKDFIRYAGVYFHFKSRLVASRCQISAGGSIMRVVIVCEHAASARL